MEVLILLALYFLPSLMAGTQHKDLKAIVVVNLFLGWTIVGWVVALAWAVKSGTKIQ